MIIACLGWFLLGMLAGAGLMAWFVVFGWRRVEDDED